MTATAVTSETLLPWLQEPWEQFLSRVQANRLPQALLLTGLSGLGQDKFAERIYHYLLCELPSLESPGESAGCHLLASGAHPDLTLLGIEEGASSIKVDAVRAMSIALAQTAQQGGYQICVINPADKMNTAASNALLKTLEEPSGNTLIILVTENSQRILPTLRSRCQEINFNIKNQQQVVDWLEKKVGEAAACSLALNEGAPLAALAFAEDEQQQANYQRFCQAINDFYQQGELVSLCQQLTELCKISGNEVILHWLQQFYQDVVRVSMGLNKVSHHALQALAEQFVKQYKLADWFAVETEWLAFAKQIRQQPNLNLQLAFENCFIATRKHYAR